MTLPLVLASGLAVAQPAPDVRGTGEATRTPTMIESRTETRTQTTTVREGGGPTSIDLDDPEARLPVREVRSTATGPGFPTDARPTPGRVGLRETPLTVGTRQESTPANWTGDIKGRGYETPHWVHESIERHRRYVQPFLTSSVLPEFSARLFTTGGVRGPDDAASFDQLLILSAYALEIYAPTLTYRDSAGFDPAHYRVNLKLPALVTDRHAILVLFGAELPVRGPLADDAGIRSMIGYAFGSDLFSAQARLGFGKDRLVAEFEEPFRTAIFYDVAAAVFLGDHFAIQAQVDGRRNLGPGNAIRIWPGVRFFPLDTRSLSIGVGGAVWLNQATDDWEIRRAGGLIDIGYQFL